VEKNNHLYVLDSGINTRGMDLQLNYQILSTFKFTNSQPIVGGGKDSHGCVTDGGYTWCQAKQKCLRSWEEDCNILSDVYPIFRNGNLKWGSSSPKTVMNFKKNSFIIFQIITYSLVLLLSSGPLWHLFLRQTYLPSEP
jgi:hypothetical protein